MMPDPRISELWPTIEAAALEAFGHLRADETSCEAVCGYIEERYREHGLDISASFVLLHEHGGKWGDLVGVRFELVDRSAVRNVDITHTVKL